MPPIVKSDHELTELGLRSPVVVFCRLDKLYMDLASDVGTLFLATPQWIIDEQGVSKTMVDCDGRVIHLSQPKTTVPARKGIIGKILRVLVTQVVPIQWAAEPGDTISLVDLKAMVNEALDSSPSFWESARPLEEWKELVAETRTHRELIEVFL